VLFLAALLIVPWQGNVSAPAILSAAREQQVTAPWPAMVVSEPGQAMSKVRAGDVLIRLFSPDLEQKIRQARTSNSVSRWQVTQQSFNEALLKQGKVLNRQFDAGATELAGLLEEKGRLTVRAPFDGVIVVRNEELNPGVWVSRKEPLYFITDMNGNRVDAYVGERDLKRLSIGASARFIPDVREFGSYQCKIAEIDRVNLPFIDEPSLASVYHGSIDTRQDVHGLLIPDTPVFRVRLSQCSPGHVPALKLRGTVHLDADRRVILADFFRYAINTLSRESGL